MDGLDEASQRFDQVHVDQLPAAALHVAVVERHHHGVGRRLGGDPVGQEERGQRRGAVGLSRHMGEPAHGLGQGAETGPVAGRAAAAVAADVQHDKLRVRPVHRLVVEAPPRQRARTVVDDQDVADVEQPVEELLALAPGAGPA